MSKNVHEAHNKTADATAQADAYDDFSNEMLDANGKVRPRLQSGVWWSCALRSLHLCVEKIWGVTPHSTGKVFRCIMATENGTLFHNQESASAVAMNSTLLTR